MKSKKKSGGGREEKYGSVQIYILQQLKAKMSAAGATQTLSAV